MCGRYSLSLTKAALIERYPGDATDLLHHPRYNIAPSQLAPVVTGSSAGWRWRMARWGFPLSSGRLVINARIETLDSRPMFRRLLGDHRCLAPADGFYEWPRGERQSRERTPYRIVRRDGSPLSFAGLWADAGLPNEPPLFVILTTESNARIARLHDRMPVILTPSLERAWLDATQSWRDLRESLAVSVPDAELVDYAVSPRVNDPHCDDPACLQPLERGRQRELW